MSKLSIAAGIVFAGLICGPSAAQDPFEVIELYGHGVHAYYSRHDLKAYELLTQVISSDTKDPRPYYFRAMTLMRMGREAEARADMEVGATLEAKDADGAYPVARSLERVQGRNRRTLEKYRRQARFGALQQRQSIQRLKYETTRQHEADVLRKQVQIDIEDVTPTDGAAPRVPTQLPAPSKIDETQDRSAANAFQPAAPEGVTPKDAGSSLEKIADPFGEPPNDTGEKTEVPESTDATPPNNGGMEADPFGDSDPFGESEASADAAKTTAPAKSATLADDSASIDVGEKVKGKKLVGILGSLLGKAISKPLENMAGNASNKIKESGMGPGPMGPGMGPVPSGMGGPDSPANGDPFGPMPGSDPASDPFGDDIKDASGTMPKETGNTDDPFGDSTPSVMEQDNGPANGSNSDPFGETPAKKGTADDPFGGASDAGDSTDDPFGDDPVTEGPATEGPATEESTEEAPSDDPFGDATTGNQAPASDPIPDDPFDF